MGRRRRSPSPSPRSARRVETPETLKTHVVWLITQRSRVQIPPPLPRPEGPFSNRERAFCMWFVHGFAHTSRRASADGQEPAMAYRAISKR